MKKISLGVLCALGILITGCDTDIPTDEIGTLSRADMCGMTGGTYDRKEDTCWCGGNKCENDVTCRYNADKKDYECLGFENKDLPELICTIQGQRICFDRINFDAKTLSVTSASGYYVECDGTKWGEPTQCPSGNSCKTYLDRTLTYSTECGECQNNGTTCINGVLIAQ